MNWESAKTWLILAFLCLDGLLGWQIVQTQQQTIAYTESYTDVLANTKTLLADHDFSLNTLIPTDHADMTTFHADAASVSLTALTSAAYGGSVSVHMQPTNQVALTPEGTVKIQSAGTWTVTYAPPVRVSKHPADDLLALLWNANNYTIDNGMQPTGVVDFTQKYNGFPIFDITASFALNNRSLTGYTQSAVANIHDVGSAKPTISALEALTSLANSVDKVSLHGNNEITSVTLGYIAKATDTTANADGNQSNYWFPVWRVVSHNATYYINAFTGELDNVI